MQRVAVRPLPPPPSPLQHDAMPPPPAPLLQRVAVPPSPPLPLLLLRLAQAPDLGFTLFLWCHVM